LQKIKSSVIVYSLQYLCYISFNEFSAVEQEVLIILKELSIKLSPALPLSLLRMLEILCFTSLCQNLPSRSWYNVRVWWWGSYVFSWVLLYGWFEWVCGIL